MFAPTRNVRNVWWLVGMCGAFLIFLFVLCQVLGESRVGSRLTSVALATVAGHRYAGLA